MGHPLVSILMPVCNGENFVAEAIQSILQQTFTDFEFIITDDGSTDNTLGIIKNYCDNRIKIIAHKRNEGLVVTRNEAVALAKGRFIAFLDSDDIAMPNRLEQQVKFLERNSEIGLLGTWVKFINGDGTSLNDCVEFPAKPDEIPVILLFKNYFITSSVMVKKSCLSELPFESEFPIAEDYNLWIKISEDYKVWNLPEVLTCYRVHDENIHKKLNQKMHEMDMLQLSIQLAKFNANFSDEEKHFFYLLGKTDSPEEYILFTKTDFIFADLCFNKLYKANKISHCYNDEILLSFIYKPWMQLFVDIKKYNLKLFKRLWQSALFKKLSLRDKMKFSIKCLMNLDRTNIR